MRTLPLALLLCFTGPSALAAPTWDLVCRYDNGSLAFSLDSATGKGQGDMRPHDQQLRKTDKTIEFDVKASETTLLQDFKVTIHLDTLKWTTNQPGWGGTCARQ
jgi:hypothetical protein